MKLESGGRALAYQLAVSTGARTASGSMVRTGALAVTVMPCLLAPLTIGEPKNMQRMVLVFLFSK